MMKNLRKVLIVIGLVMLSALFIGLIYIGTAKVFGMPVNNDAATEYALRADNYYDGRFHNMVELSNSEIDETDPNKDSTTGKGTYPEEDLPIVEPSFGNCPDNDIQITWYGHSTLLITMHGLNLLVDPIFSDYLGLNKLMGSRRFEKIHSYAKDLPNIDVCILTHDHFDHLDYETIKEIDSKIDKYIVPLGLDGRLERMGVSSDKITDMAWWEEQSLDGLTVACTPAQHSSGRLKIDEKRTLWCSYVFKDENNQIFLTGDSGFSEHFEKIHDVYGDMDFVLTDGAQYGEEKDKHTNHMFPEESAKVVSIMGADKAMLIHWGSFCLSNWHAWDDPPTRFATACAQAGIDNITPMIGQTFLLSNTKDLHTHWWEAIE